jgi:hypothetical protein
MIPRNELIRDVILELAEHDLGELTYPDLTQRVFASHLRLRQGRWGSSYRTVALCVAMLERSGKLTVTRRKVQNERFSATYIRLSKRGN